MKRFIITESEKSEIRKMYGLFNEQAQLPVTVNGNFTATNCDELHAFQGTGGKTIGDMNGKVQQKISELNKQGLKVKVVNVAVNVKGMSVSWSVTIDNSNDGKNWVGFTSRGAGCNNNIETRWNNESVGNGPESIKNKIKEVGIGTVDQIELVKTFTHSDGGNSFKQGFYRYCLVGQNQNNQNQNNQNQNNQNKTGQVKYQVGKTYLGTRSTDKKDYRLTIKNVGPEGKYYVVDIQGPGLYDGKPMNRPGMELYPIPTGGLEGNMEMGKFQNLRLSN
jgi:hypothetical protein